jgi:hypothetical protein
MIDQAEPDNLISHFEIHADEVYEYCQAGGCERDRLRC